MAYISARAIYLVITFGIIVLFGATGTYYFLDLQKNLAVTKKQEAEQFYESPETIAEATPQPTIASQLSICQQDCEFSFQCDGDLECLEVGTTKVCANPNCPDSISCVCDESKQATASAQASAMPAQYNIESGIGANAPLNTPVPTVTPTAKPTVKPTPKPTVKAVLPIKTPEIYDVEETVDEYDPKLPEAGFPLVSIAMLILAVVSTSTGLWWLNRKSSN